MVSIEGGYEGGKGKEKKERGGEEMSSLFFSDIAFFQKDNAMTRLGRWGGESESCHTSVNPPLSFSSVHSAPSVSFSLNGPPIRGRPIPFDMSAIFFRSSRSFSCRK